MALCTLCYATLSFMSKPTMGQGKLLDGNEICFKCFTKVRQISPGAIFKGLTTDEVQALLSNVPKISDQVERSEAIKQKLISLGISGFWGAKEVKALPSILMDDEDIIDAVLGSYNKAVGVAVATNKRLIFLDKGFFSAKVEDFPYDRISSIQYETGFAHGKIFITVTGNRAAIESVLKARVKPFADTIRNKLSEKSEPQQVIINNPVNVADQLEKLASLKEKGLLTDEEFQTQKQKLLSL